MKSSRLMALTGPAFAVVFALAVFLFSTDGPGEDASAKAVLDYADDHQSDLFVGAFAGPLIAALLVLFFSHLRSLARARGDAGAGPSIMLGGAVLWAGGVLLGSTLDLAAVSVSDNDLEQAAQTVNVLIAVSWIPFIAGVAVTLLGAGMTVLGTGILPRWLGWVALVVGVVSLLGPGGFLGFFVAPLFMLVAGILLLRAPDEAAAV
jgi:hypothetical protein